MYSSITCINNCKNKFKHTWKMSEVMSVYVSFVVEGNIYKSNTFCYGIYVDEMNMSTSIDINNPNQSKGCNLHTETQIYRYTKSQVVFTVLRHYFPVFRRLKCFLQVVFTSRWGRASGQNFTLSEWLWRPSSLGLVIAMSLRSLGYGG